MEHISGALKKLIKKEGIENEINQQKAIDLWGDVVGQKIKENTEPLEVQFGILTVKTKNPVWRQELQIQKEDIIKSINKKLVKTMIKDLRFI
tara:strand:+ start:20321 stop:20596 length:276 start_codon:yes stop_codon:yes gene_type:complete